MVKIQGWRKSLFGEHWKSEQGSHIKIVKTNQGYAVLIVRKGFMDKSKNKRYSKVFPTKKEAINFAIEFMKNNREDNYFKADYFIVSIDFDGVLAHGLNAKRKYAKKWFGVNLTLDQTKKEGFENLMKKLGRYPQINYRSLMDKLNEEHIMEYEVPPGCISALRRLHSQGFRFVIITSRNDHDYPYAKKFVRHHFGNLIKNIHNTRNEPKDTFVRKLRPRIHMDDDMRKLYEIRNEPVYPLWYRQPENSSQGQFFSDVITGQAIREIHSWKDFVFACERLRNLQEEVCQKYGIENKWYNIEKIHKLTMERNAR